MSYVDRVLQPGEELRYRSRIHWLVYLPGILIIVATLVIVGLASDYVGQGQYTPSILGILAFGFVIALISLISAWFRRWTTEVAVTDRRVIYKRGFIRRRTIEMNMSKVESVDVDQSMLGRLFDYGDITVRGTGSTLEPLRMISAPLDFRNHVTAG
jgi:uncharacterized membrane protein YdbT with pleckstrin-like domain